MTLIVTGVGLADPRLLDRVHEGGPELRAVLRLPQPVPVLHAAAGPRAVDAGAVRRLGRRGARVVPADRVLVRGPRKGARGQEGVHHQPHRRRRLPAGNVPALLGAGHAGHGPDQQRLHRNHASGGLRQPRRHPAVRRRHRQVGADPAARLAARRDGGPDPGVGADPRGDDGDRRRLSRRPDVRPLHAGAGRLAGHRRGRRGDGVLRRDHRRRADRHQEGARLFHRLAAGPHVRGAGRGGLRRRDLPRLHPRVLQGLPVPRRRQRDPCHERRAGHPQDGRAGEEDPRHLRHLRHRHGGDLGHSRRWPGSSPRTRSCGSRSAAAAAARRCCGPRPPPLRC